MNKAILSLAGASLLVGSADAQVTKKADGYLLRVKYTKGAVLKFNSENTLSGLSSQPKGSGKFQMPLTLTVLDVKDGKSKVELKLGAVNMGNNVISQGQTAVIELDNRNQGAAQSGVGVTLPLKPLRVGNSWTAIAPVSSSFGRGNLNAVYTFAGLKTVKGKSVAVITYKLSGYASGTGKLTLLVSDGTLFTNDVQLRFASEEGKPPIMVNSAFTRK